MSGLLEALSDAAKAIPYGYSNSRHKSLKVSKLFSPLPPFGGVGGEALFWPTAQPLLYSSMPRDRQRGKQLRFRQWGEKDWERPARRQKRAWRSQNRAKTTLLKANYPNETRTNSRSPNGASVTSRWAKRIAAAQMTLKPRHQVEQLAEVIKRWVKRRASWVVVVARWCSWGSPGRAVEGSQD